MDVHFVMGPTHSGKSTFIASRPELASAVQLDALDVQAYCRQETLGWSRDRQWELAAATLCETVDAAKERGDERPIVMEMTGLSRPERKIYIDMLVPHLDDEDRITGWWLFATPDDLEARLRNENFEAAGKFVARQLDASEAPSLGEGFSDLHAIYTSGVTDADTQVLDQARIHFGYKGADPDAARDLLRRWGEGELASFYYPKAGEFTKKLKQTLAEMNATAEDGDDGEYRYTAPLDDIKRMRRQMEGASGPDGERLRAGGQSVPAPAPAPEMPEPSPEQPEPLPEPIELDDLLAMQGDGMDGGADAGPAEEPAPKPAPKLRIQPRYPSRAAAQAAATAPGAAPEDMPGPDDFEDEDFDDYSSLMAAAGDDDFDDLDDFDDYEPDGDDDLFGDVMRAADDGVSDEDAELWDGLFDDDDK